MIPGSTIRLRGFHGPFVVVGMDIPEPICYEGWEIPWPMCRKEKYQSPCLGECWKYSWAHVLVWVGGIFQCLV